MTGRTRARSAQTATTASTAHNHPYNGKGLAREQVTGIQRARMLVAMAEAANEHGGGSVTVGQVVERAGVSRRTFYEIFDDSEDCLLAAFDHAVASASERVLPAFRAEGHWRERMRGALQALLEFFDVEPFLGRLLVVESLGGGRRLLDRRSRVVAELVRAVDAGRSEATATSSATPLSAEGVVGGILSVIHDRMLQQEPDLVELLNPLMGMVVTPYLGAAAARGELQRPLVRAPAPAVTVAPASPMRGLGLRLTYRTVCVLEAIAATPGSSNRRIGEAAGMSDQGQISKLLARLERFRLVENASAGHARGEPNAWKLTARGAEVNGAIVKHSHG